MVKSQIGVPGSSTLGVSDLEDLSVARLAGPDEEELLTAVTECTLVFHDDEMYPRGVIVSFCRHRGAFWIASVAGRLQVRCLEANPSSSIVVSNAGSALPGRRMVSFRGHATILSDEETKEEMLPLIARRLAPGDPAAMVKLLDSPNRVLIRFVPVGPSVSHDSRRIAGDGRGGASEA